MRRMELGYSLAKISVVSNVDDVGIPIAWYLLLRILMFSCTIDSLSGRQIVLHKWTHKQCIL